MNVAPLRWWGWGDRPADVPSGLAALLGVELGFDLSRGTTPPRLADVSMPASALLDDPLLTSLRHLCGEEAVLIDHETRVRHAAGRNYADLVRLRSGVLDSAPDAVVLPADEDAVAGVLRACAAAGCAVVPFGGGTSVVGGVSPLRGHHRAVVALSLRRLDRCTAVDTVSMTATLQAGMTGPAVEAVLGALGLTLGHFPQSFEYATVGGFAATRSAGQASSGYGRFDDLVLGLRAVAPNGRIEVAAHPATAAGPSVAQLLLGSEGRLGVITEVTVKVRRVADRARYEAWSFATFDDGVAAMRAMAQGRVAPDVARLSDSEETRTGMAVAAHGGLVESIGRLYLRARGQLGGCLLVMGWDSDALVGGSRQAEARALVRRHRGVPLGSSPGASWRRQRYHGPYLRDALMDHGVLVETLETATSWRTLHTLHDAVASSLRTSLAESGGALVGCHVSHVYPSGASLYFTVIGRAGDDPVAQWLRAKRAACTAILDNGGTVTHHHAVGTDHREYMPREVGEDALAILRAAAAQLDPTGIMNPGKLLPD